jgi:hypothetical protein
MKKVEFLQPFSRIWWRLFWWAKTANLPLDDGSRDSNWDVVESTVLDEDFSAASAFIAASSASGTSVLDETHLRL